jgi:hypothetical protein
MSETKQKSAAYVETTASQSQRDRGIGPKAQLRGKNYERARKEELRIKKLSKRTPGAVAKYKGGETMKALRRLNRSRTSND